MKDDIECEYGLDDFEIMGSVWVASQEFDKASYWKP